MEPATYQEIVTECPGATSDFICAQLAAGASSDEARRQWMAQLNQRNQQMEQAAQPLRKPGVQPVHSGATGQSYSGGDPVGEADDRVRAHMEKHNCDRFVAQRAVFNRDPELHAAYKAATAEKLR